MQAGQGRSCRQPGKLATHEGLSVAVEAGLKEGKLLEALEPLKGEGLLMFTDMRQAFGGFTHSTDAKRSAYAPGATCQRTEYAPILPGRL